MEGTLIDTDNELIAAAPTFVGWVVSSPKRPRRAGVVLLLAMLLVLTGCSRAIPGTLDPGASEPPSQPALPLAPDQVPVAEFFATARTWDLCAVHDIEAAARVTGYLPDWVGPSGGLDVCRLRLKQADGPGAWDLVIAVSTAQLTTDAPQITVGGIQLRQVRESGLSCSYSYPAGPSATGVQWGLELRSYAYATTTPPCDVAREYASAVAQRIAEPPLRTDGQTRPALTLAGVDPCALAAAMAPVLADAPVAPENLSASVTTPYECGVVVRLADPGQLIPDAIGSVLLTVTPGPLTGSTVAGRPAAREEVDGVCAVTFQAGEVQIAGNPGDPAMLEAVQVSGSTCEIVDRLAAAAAKALGPPIPPPTAADDAVALGDLDPPPTAASVGAPFDPCTDVRWNDYPPDVRPTPPTPPTPAAVSPRAPHSAGCSFDAGPMSSLVVWGKPSGAFSVDPSSRTGATSAQFGGKPGLEQHTVLDDGSQVCYSAVQLNDGIAAITTLHPNSDPCAINRSVLDRLAARIP